MADDLTKDPTRTSDTTGASNASALPGTAGTSGAAGAKKTRDRVLIAVLLIGALAIAIAVFTSWMFGKEKMPDYVGYPLEGAEKQQVIEQNSPLIDYVCLTPSADFPRDQQISKITIHHMAADPTLEDVGARFLRRDVQASANYGIDSYGNVALYVEEANRSWASRNRENDNAAVTIEVANDVVGDDWHVSDKAFDKLVALCVDICKRNGIEKIDFTGDASGNLTYHGMFDGATECPGPYLKSRMQDLADAINEQLGQ